MNTPARRPTAWPLLVAALLVLSGRSAGAQTAFFTEAHPWEDLLRRPFPAIEAEGTSSSGTPQFVDYDEDGDVDILISDEECRLQLMERTAAGWDWPRVIGDYICSAALLDVDADGDLDLIGARTFGYGGSTQYYERVASGAFELRSSAGRFPVFNSPPSNQTVPTVGDVDGDGLVDILVAVRHSSGGGVFENRLYYVRQTAPGVFEDQVGAANPFGSALLSAGVCSAGFGDADGDGDLDVPVYCRVSNAVSKWTYFEQTASGVYTERTGSSNPFAVLDGAPYLRFTVVDVDGDGDLDVVGTEDAHALLFRFVEHTPAGFAPRQGLYDLFGGLGFSGPSTISGGTNSAEWLTFGDVEGDGDDDLLFTSLSGALIYVRRTASATAPFEFRGGQLSPFHAITAVTNTHPALGDVDGDGDGDLVLTRIGTGPARYYEQVDVNLFAEQTGGASPFAGLSVGPYPALGDVDGDGDLDLVTANWGEGRYDRLLYFEQTGGGTFAERTGTANPFDGLSTYYCGGAAPSNRPDARPVLADLDDDGDLDLISGRCFFKNTPAGFLPVFAGSPLLELPETGCGGGFYSLCYVAALQDLDGDGDLDAVVPQYSGSFLRTFVNSGTLVASEPGPDGASAEGALSPPVPNPAGPTGSVRLTLTVDQAQAVQAVLYDALGRRVALLYDGVAAAGRGLALEADVSALPPGLYLVRVNGDTFTASQRVTVTR